MMTFETQLDRQIARNAVVLAANRAALPTSRVQVAATADEYARIRAEQEAARRAEIARIEAQRAERMKRVAA